MVFVKANNETPFVVWGEYKKEKAEKNQYLVKENETIVVMIDEINESEYLPGKKYIVGTLMKVEGVGDKAKVTSLEKQVTMTPTGYLETDFGWNEKCKKDKVMGVGDIFMATYRGRDVTKPKQPYMFDYEYWE